jgi:hypothetical protein
MHVCKLGHEGIVAKRKDLPYESGRSKRWLKIRNQSSPAMKRYDEGTFQDEKSAFSFKRKRSIRLEQTR